MIEQILVVSLIVIAIWYTMLDGEIFGRLGNWFVVNLPAWAHNPAFDCPVCMVPWYGTVICLLLGYPWWTIFPAMGLNVIIVKIWRPDE